MTRGPACSPCTFPLHGQDLPTLDLLLGEGHRQLLQPEAHHRVTRIPLLGQVDCRLDSYSKNGKDVLKRVKGTCNKKQIMGGLWATEGYIALSFIADGLLQPCALKDSSEINASLR